MRIVLLFTVLSFNLFAQTKGSFSGRLVYSIEVTDTTLRNLYPPKVMQVYTNDTLVRIENETSQFGLQIAIRHLMLNKSYLLISTDQGNFAIQTTFDESTKKPSKYSFQKKFGTKKIGGRKAKKVIATHELFKDPMNFYYFKHISSKFLEGFESFPGLLVEFYVPTEDVVYKYTLKSIEFDPTNPDLYGIPSDFKKISMSDFVDLMTTPQEEGE